jgi:outer membrane protein OmpA-like peptidoglycan-associated protein
MKNTIRTLLLLSAVVCITPASANYFANPGQGTNLNIGSAPNPTPADLRRGVVAGERIVPYADDTRTPLFTFSEAAPSPVQTPPLVSREVAPLRVQSPAPPVVPREFFVFFDFDRSELTPEARQIVAIAVSAAQETGMTRIVVVGHTDAVGSMHYNQALSERRATVVKSEMMRLGLNAGGIVTSGRNFSEPAVLTERGVREWQNRRTMIELNYNLSSELAPNSNRRE